MNRGMFPPKTFTTMTRQISATIRENLLSFVDEEGNGWKLFGTARNRRFPCCGAVMLLEKCFLQWWYTNPRMCMQVGLPTDQHAVYDCTKSGWFDSASFKIWFLEVLLPSTRCKRGPVVIFGDNLSSHFIYFVMLLANATNWLQVLDVAVFGPMKRSWRTVLLEWRMTTRRHGEI